MPIGHDDSSSRHAGRQPHWSRVVARTLTVMSDPSQLVARLDGILVPPTLPLLRADDLGVLRGDGVFETTLAVDGEPRDLPEHLARMRVSAELLGMTIPNSGAWLGGVAAVTAAWTGGDEMVLRLIATRGPEGSDEPTCYVMGSTPDVGRLAARRGVRVMTLDRGLTAADLADKPYLLPGAKSLSYAVNMAAGRWARDHGADDAIFVGPDGSVLEGPTANVVIVRGRELVTPPADGILAGITVARLFVAAEAAGWQVTRGPVTAQDLREADGVYLTSSVRLLAPVVEVDGAERAHDEALTAELAALLLVPAGPEDNGVEANDAAAVVDSDDDASDDEPATVDEPVEEPA